MGAMYRGYQQVTLPPASFTLSRKEMSGSNIHESPGRAELKISRPIASGCSLTLYEWIP